MKHYYLMIFVLLCSCTQSSVERKISSVDTIPLIPTEHLTDPKGFHGMLFFGSLNHFYVSHLPMFHRPHDYQVILKVNFDEKHKEKVQQFLKSNNDPYLTFAPKETFVLPQVVNEKKSFSGTLFDGHFERGARPFLNLELSIEKVVYYSKIPNTLVSSDRLHYLLFLDSEKKYLVHQIGQRPSKDHFFELVEEPSIRSITSTDFTVLRSLDGEKISDNIIPKKFETKEGRVIELNLKQFYQEISELK